MEVYAKPRTITVETVKALYHAYRLERSNDRRPAAKMCIPLDVVAAVLGVDMETLRPLVSSGNGFNETNYKEGGKAEINLRNKSNRVLCKWNNASRLLLSFDGMVSLVALVQNNPIAVEVRNYLNHTIKKEFLMLEREHKTEARLRSEHKEASATIKKSKAMFPDLVEKGGRHLVTVKLGKIMKQEMTGVVTVKDRNALLAATGATHQNYKSVLSLAGAVVNQSMYVIANACMNEGLPAEQIVHQTRQATLAVQTAMNLGRPLDTKEEKRGFMTRPNTKKRKQKFAEVPAEERPRTRTLRLMAVQETPMVALEDSQYETADEGGNDDGNDDGN